MKMTHVALGDQMTGESCLQTMKSKQEISCFRKKMNNKK